MTFGPTNSIGPYLQQNVTFSEDEEQRLLQHTSVNANVARAVNLREISIYQLSEISNGQQFFTAGNPQSNRYAFRKVFNIGPIATGATSTTAHGITQETIFTRIYGTCVTDVVDYRPIPYSSTVALNQQISLTITGTNIVIVNGAASPNITSCIVVLEYLKS